MYLRKYIYTYLVTVSIKQFETPQNETTSNFSGNDVIIKIYLRNSLNKKYITVYVRLVRCPGTIEVPSEICD